MSTFNTNFQASAAGLLAQFGTSVQRWPGGDDTAVVSETWMIEFENQQGPTTDQKGRSADLFVVLVGLVSIQVTRHDKFKFTHPDTGLEVVANAIRPLPGGAMQRWYCVIPRGIDTRHARVRR
jgi:hypothetical protein